MNVIENLLNHVWLSNCRYNAQLATAFRTHFDIDGKDPLEPFSPGKRSKRTIGFSIGIYGGL